MNKRLTQDSIIFIHGLRGHPRRTWEGCRGPASSAGEAAVPRQRKNIFKSIFKPKSSRAETEQLDQPSKIFWPKEYLVEDLPDARVWTYGYDADAIGGLFQAKNKNSISKHGNDLKVKVEREVENEDPIVFVAHSLGGIIVKDVSR